MNRLSVLGNGRGRHFSGYGVIKVWALLFCFGLGAFAQSAASPVNAPTSIRATHILGLENMKINSNGILSIQDNALRFQRAGEPTADVDITSIQAVFLGSESKQVGGVPMMLAKAAAPFGGGRVVSLVAHKKYDTLTLEYIDSNGGFHGVIFQVNKGQGELVKDELLGRGVSRNSGEAQSTKPSTEGVRNERN